MPDGTAIIVEEVRTGRKQLALQTMWKYPGTRDADALLHDAKLYVQNVTGDAQIIVHFDVQGNPVKDTALKRALPPAALQAKGDQPDKPTKPHPSSYGVGINDEVFFHHPGDLPPINCTNHCQVQKWGCNSRNS